MQTFIAKYGLAAHLALLAVAPLFLFPLCSEGTVAIVVLWLSLVVCVWCLLAPSVRPNESLHAARTRVVRAVRTDPLFWFSFALVLFAGARALNVGVRVAYDSEKLSWALQTPAFPFYPGCVEDAGFLPFTATLAIVFILISMRHSLGRSGRMAFLLISASLAGLGALIAGFLAREGDVACVKLMTASLDSPSFAGVAYGVYFLAGVCVLLSLFEYEWNRAMILLPLAIGGTAFGTFAYAPPVISGLFGIGGLLILAYCVFFAFRTIRGTAEFKLLVICCLALAIGGLLAVWLLPDEILDARLSVFSSGDFIPEKALELRRTLSDIAFRAWKETLWIGTGLGSFAFDIRFNALPADWVMIPRGQTLVPNGGWFLLVERGLIGAAIISVLLGFLAVTYVRRLVGWVRHLSLPQPSCFLAPVTAVILGLLVAFDCSFLRADLTLAAISIFALSAKSFPSNKKNKRKMNG